MIKADHQSAYAVMFTYAHFDSTHVQISRNIFVFLFESVHVKTNNITCASSADLGPNTLKSIQIHYSYFDLSMITITLQLQDL